MHSFAFALNSKGDLGKSFPKTVLATAFLPTFHSVSRLHEASEPQSRTFPSPLPGSSHWGLFQWQSLPHRAPVLGIQLKEP